MTNQYSIKDLEELSGIKAHTLRIWEKRYGFIKPKRTKTNIRYYTDEQLVNILNVSLLNNNGYKISKIARLHDEEIKKIVSSIYDTSSNSESIINELIKVTIDFDETGFERIFSHVLLERSIEAALLEVIYPFLKRIGLLWRINKILPAQEHFISNLIRQKIIVAIDQLGSVDSSIPQKTFVLFLPEWELHEIGLLSLHLLLKRKGFRVVYLGAMMPLKELSEVLTTASYDYLFTIFTTSKSKKFLEKYLSEIYKINNDKPFIISGGLISKHHLQLQPNQLFLEHIADVQTFIEQLH